MTITTADAFARSELARTPDYADSVLAALAADGWEPALNGVLVSVTDADGTPISITCRPLTGETVAAQVAALVKQAQADPDNRQRYHHRAARWVDWAFDQNIKLPSLVGRPTVQNPQPPVEPYPQPLPKPKPQPKPPRQDRKEIVYDRETGDYAMYLDGEFIGYARSHHEAEITLDDLVRNIARCVA